MAFTIKLLHNKDKTINIEQEFENLETENRL